MARYVYNIDNHYKQPIPYHFTCNYCGEVCEKSFETTVSVKATGRHLGDAQRATGRQHDRQVKKAAKEKKRAIERYRAKLLAGKTASGAKLAYIPLKSDCDHCGKCQMWNPAIDRKQYTSGGTEAMSGIGLIVGVVGFVGLFIGGILYATSFGHTSPLVPCISAGVLFIGMALSVIGGRIDDRREAAWFREHLSSEPNDPEKLPVIDK